jgi:hypothetical protein
MWRVTALRVRYSLYFLMLLRDDCPQHPIFNWKIFYVTSQDSIYLHNYCIKRSYRLNFAFDLAIARWSVMLTTHWIIYHSPLRCAMCYLHVVNETVTVSSRPIYCLPRSSYKCKTSPVTVTHVKLQTVFWSNSYHWPAWHNYFRPFHGLLKVIFCCCNSKLSFLGSVLWKFCKTGY